MQRRLVRLGTSEVAVAYPHALAQWFDGFDKAGRRRPAKWVRIAPSEADRFSVSTSVDAPVAGLTLGDALATLWERVAFLLVDDLRDALAVHAAALTNDKGLVLIPGASGAGKTSLSLWYRQAGFDLNTDEIFCASLEPPAEQRVLVGATLARPLFIKHGNGAAGLLRSGETDLEEISSGGLVVRPETPGPRSSFRVDQALIVFPRYKADAPISLTALTTAQSGFRLLENCVNARNLPRGGLPLASALAGQARAVALEYGETGQLTGTLDVLTQHVFSVSPDAKSFADLCSVLSASAAARAAGPRITHRTIENPAPAAVEAPTVKRLSRRLTIGMATYDDYDGVYFTIQSIRTQNPDIDNAIEFVVVDNNPDGRCSAALKNLGNSIGGYRYLPRGDWKGTAVRDLVFAEADCSFVLCVDSHILLAAGALPRLLAYSDANPESRDLLQGPLLYDDLRSFATHFEPRWQEGMYGVWESDPRGEDPQAAPFDIPMQGLGLFACRRAAWPGFNPKFRGFGGEEGYIHEKTRQRGGRTLCLPFLRWVHRFDRPLGPPYRNTWEDRIHNYYVGFTELGLDTAEMEAHFMELLGAETCGRILAEIKAAYPVPERENRGATLVPRQRLRKTHQALAFDKRAEAQPA
jgi:Glycosyl transferase family 2